MKNKSKTQYRLYANSISDNNVEFAGEQRFSLITPDYLLIYTTDKVKGWPEITDDNIYVLTERDRKWLFECNMELIAEEIAERGGRFGIDMEKAIEELENALKREKESLSG